MKWRVGWALCLVLFINGCSLTQPLKTPSVDRYALNRVSKLRLQTRASAKTLLISAPVASPGYSGNEMIYVKKPYQLQAFSRNGWISPPAKMLQPLLTESLRNANLFKAVVSSPFAGLTDYRLDSKLLVLQQEFLGGKNQIRLVLQADLVGVAHSRVIRSERFEVLMPVTAANPYSGVIAANRAVEKVLTQCVRFVAETVQR